MRIAIRAERADAERARARMLEIFPGGFEEREEGARVELAGYASPAAAADVRALLTGSRDAASHDCVSPSGGVATWTLTASEVEPGWETAWQRFHRPVIIGGVWIGPSWESAPAGLTRVVLEPGMAFGTGSHPTTRLCLELLLQQPRGPLLDLGCGSGVLAIVGASAGFDPVSAVDLEQVAVDEARANARRNGLRLDVRRQNAEEVDCPQAALVTANLPLRLLRACMSRLQPARAVVSGFRAGEWSPMIGYRVGDRREHSGWEAAVLVRAERSEAV